LFPKIELLTEEFPWVDPLPEVGTQSESIIGAKNLKKSVVMKISERNTLKRVAGDNQPAGIVVAAIASLVVTSALLAQQPPPAPPSAYAPSDC
jgi:hypothetical protein